MSRDRLLIIDADVSKRLAAHLTERQRDSIAAVDLGLEDDKDPELLRALAKNYNGKREWVLVTGDDAMPAEHGAVIMETAATIATIHPGYPKDEMTEHAWRMDVVQRWAHRMQAQVPQTVRRYSLNGSELWHPRQRHLRKIDLHGWTPWKPSEPERSPAASTPDPRFNPRQDPLPGLG